MAIGSPDTALTTETAVLSYLDIKDDSEQAIVSDLIRRASGMVSTFCSRRFTQTTHTEIHDGPDSANLYLHHWPVDSPLSGVGAGVWVDSTRQFTASTALTEDTGSGTGSFVVYSDEKDQGRLVRTDGIWPKGVRNVKVIYQAGYATIPDTVEHWTLRLVAYLRNIQLEKMHAQTTQSIGEHDVSIIDHVELPADVKKGLMRWRKVRFYG